MGALGWVEADHFRLDVCVFEGEVIYLNEVVAVFGCDAHRDFGVGEAVDAELAHGGGGVLDLVVIEGGPSGVGDEEELGGEFGHWG